MLYKFQEETAFSHLWPIITILEQFKLDKTKCVCFVHIECIQSIHKQTHILFVLTLSVYKFTLIYLFAFNYEFVRNVQFTEFKWETECRTKSESLHFGFHVPKYSMQRVWNVGDFIWTNKPEKPNLPYLFEFRIELPISK